MKDADHRSAPAHYTALIIESGAMMRSIFSAGLLDRFLQEGLNPFDFYIGVSAGAMNLAAFLVRTPRAFSPWRTPDRSRLAVRSRFFTKLTGHLCDLQSG